jgi:hypothetical protein
VRAWPAENWRRRGAEEAAIRSDDVGGDGAGATGLAGGRWVGGLEFAGGAFGPIGALKNPLVEEPDFLFAEAMVSAGHGLCEVIRQDGDEEEGAALGFTGKNDGATFVGSHDAIEGRQVESGALGLCIVTEHAFGFENGFDICHKLDIGALFLELECGIGVGGHHDDDGLRGGRGGASDEGGQEGNEGEETETFHDGGRLGG